MERRRRTLSDVVEALRVHQPGLRQRYGVTSIAVFGSWVHDSVRPESDVDLLVEFDDRPVSLFQFVALRDELSDLLGVSVDLVEKDALRPGIGARIINEAVYV